MAVTPDHDGPDISHWNPIANWDDIPNYDLWCMKATEGRGFKSPVFDTNWAKCRELRAQGKGAKYLGAYHWIRSDSSQEDQVKNLKRAIDAHGGLQDGEFVMLDWETTPGIRNVYVSEVEQWLNLAEKHWPGKIIVYASDWVPGFKTWRNKYPDYPLWYANYRLIDDSRGGKAETDQWGADVWQWTSKADVPGFADDTIDMNDVLDWSWFESLYPGGAPAPAPEPEQPAAWPPYTPPSSYSLWPLAKDKVTLKNKSPRQHSELERYTVTYLQDVLKHEARQRIVVDGWFGPQTELAVKNLQQFFGLHIDGIVGNKQTWPVVDYIATD